MKNKILIMPLFLSIVFGLTACGGGMSDMEACSKKSALYAIDQFAEYAEPEKVEEAKKAIMSISWEEMQKAEKAWGMYIGICEKLKAEEPDKFKKAVKGEFE